MAAVTIGYEAKSARTPQRERSVADPHDPRHYDQKAIEERQGCSITPEQLAFEFLRRNPDYQREFSQLPEVGDDQALRALGLKWGLRYRALDPFREPPSPSAHWGDWPGELARIVAFVGSHRVDILDPRAYDWSRGYPPTPFLLPHVFWNPEHQDQLAVVFDLKLPIEPQINQVKALLLERQRRRDIKPEPAKALDVRQLLVYLRLLDADAAGLDRREMQQLDSALSVGDPESDRRKLYRWLKAAKALRDGGYRDIVGGYVTA